MPIYEYKCEECGIVIEEVRSMAQCYDCPKCPTCDGKTKKLISCNIHATNDYTKPLHSDSLAVPAAQADEHRKLFPEVSLDSQNRPIFTNPKQHDAYLEKTGFVKHKKRSRKRGRTIA